MDSTKTHKLAFIYLFLIATNDLGCYLGKVSSQLCPVVPTFTKQYYPKGISLSTINICDMF